MNFEELEEALDELLPAGYEIDVDKHGQVIVRTNLKQDEDGELHTISDDEIDPDFDPDFDPLEEDEEDE